MSVGNPAAGDRGGELSESGEGALDWIIEGRGEWADGPTLGKKYLWSFESPWTMAQFDS